MKLSNPLNKIVIKGIPLSKVFNFYTFITWLIRITIQGIVLFIICNLVLNKVQDNHRNHNINIIQTIDHSNDKDIIKNNCAALDCIYAIKYDNKDAVLIIENTFNGKMNMITDVNLIDNILNTIKKDRIDTNVMFDNVTYFYHIYNISILKHQIFIYIFLISSIITTVYYFTSTFIRIHFANTENRFAKEQLETKLQRNLTESLHHELIPSIGILNVYIKELYQTIFKDIEVSNYSRVVVNDETYEKYNNDILLSTTDVSKILDKYNHFESAINRMSAVLTIISNSKHLKYNKNTIPLIEMIDSAYCSVMIYQIHKPNITYAGRDLFKSYTTSNGLDAGIFGNIITVMLMNAVEANASDITIDAKMSIRSGMMEITISDNGVGIRRPNGDICTLEETDKIFVYGYSTKDNHNKPLTIKERFIIALIESIFSRFYSIDDLRERSSRGSGLSFNQTILRSVGGNIEVKETTKDGTKFLLTIPVKELTPNRVK